jgi:hypothetical protein
MNIFVTKSLRLTKPQFRKYCPKFQVPLEPGVDYIVDKNFVEDPIELGKRISNMIEKKQQGSYIPLWRQHNELIFNKKMTPTEATSIELDTYNKTPVETAIPDTSSIDIAGNQWREFFRSGQPSTIKFNEFYDWFTEQPKEIKKPFLNFLKSIDRQDIIQKLEAIFLRKLILLADRNMEKEKNDIKESVVSRHPEVKWEHVPKGQRELWHQKQMKAIATEELKNDPTQASAEGLGPDDAHFTDKMDEMFVDLNKIDPPGDGTEFRHAKRFSQTAFPQFKGSDPRDLPKRQTINPDDEIFTQELKEIKKILEEYKQNGAFFTSEVDQYVRKRILPILGYVVDHRKKENYQTTHSFEIVEYLVGSHDPLKKFQKYLKGLKESATTEGLWERTPENLGNVCMRMLLCTNLNQHRMYKFFSTLFGNPNLKEYYSGNSFMRKKETQDALLKFFQMLDKFPFQMVVTMERNEYSVEKF